VAIKGGMTLRNRRNGMRNELRNENNLVTKREKPWERGWNEKLHPVQCK
jgi:hypothetical protein